MKPKTFIVYCYLSALYMVNESPCFPTTTRLPIGSKTYTVSIFAIIPHTKTMEGLRSKISVMYAICVNFVLYLSFIPFSSPELNIR
uniref:Uncharacterized protein n=1 Tax=Pyxicephalus adspersus TaxID=30357 RepID=A0AAV3B6R0_PYXAD|nr:TPA: hypothetical protein GDO54_007129 [Pyxicephalus adspersus]